MRQKILIAALYATFGTISIVVNIGTQMGVSMLYQGPYGFWAALMAGTVTGLVTKYWLDNHYIFKDLERGIRAHSRKLFLYSLLGGITTVLFWGTEIAFEFLIDHPQARYWGAVIGLSAGYTIKYHLDKRFVFRARKELLQS